MRKLVLVLSLVLAVATVMAQPYMFITVGSTDYSTSANNSGGGIINWIDMSLNGGLGDVAPNGFLPTGEDIIVDANALVIDVNTMFKSIRISGTPGEIVVDPGVTLTVTTAFSVEGILTGTTGTINVVGGPFTIVSPGSATLGGATLLGVPPVIIAPPPVPVSPWGIVLGVGLIAGFTIVYKRRKQVLV